MQNIDFYDGKNSKPLSPQFDQYDMEYFSRMSNSHTREEEKTRKRASRIIFLIGALCIISFTTGIVVGIKFTGGADHKIVDPHTYNAVKGIGSKVSSLIKEQKNTPSGDRLYPVENYPYVIRVGNSYSAAESKNLATFLSQNGNTVILSKNNDRFNIYTGPYKNQEEAKKSLKKISQYSGYAFADNLKILKRL